MSFLNIHNGINLGNLAADPGTANNGDLYYNTSSNTTRVYINGAWTDVVDTNTSQALGNKEIANSTIVDTTVFKDDGDPTKTLAIELTNMASSATLTISPNQGSNGELIIPSIGASDSLVTNDTAANLTNKILDGANIKSNSYIGNIGDTSKRITFLPGGSPSTTLTIQSLQGTSQQLSIPTLTAADTIVVEDNAATLSNKTLTSPVIDTPTLNGSGGELTLPAGPDTLVGRDTTDTHTNKTLTSPTIDTPTLNGSGGTLTLPAGPDTLVGLATTDTLTNKTIGDSTTYTQVATPSNPSAGFNKVYVKSDGNLYILDSSGTETQIGAGGGGSSTYTATAGETLVAGDVVYVASTADSGRTAGQLYKLDATNELRIEYAGIVTTGAASAATATVSVAGRVSGLSGLLAGQPVFASVSAPGALQTDAPSIIGQYIVQVGTADSTTSLVINGALSATATLITEGTSANTTVQARNYVQYGNFENNATTGWSLFNTTLTSLIPTGSITAGASSITTFATSASSPLADTYSLSVAASTSLTAGHGFISDALSINRDDQAKVLSFNFDYNVVSGSPNMSGTSSNTLAVYLYDVANSAWVQPAGVYNLVQSSGVGRCVGTFQTASNATSYRIAVLCVNALGSAVSFLFDQFYMGPQATAQAPAMSDWVSFTPTGSWVTNTTYNGRYRRVGDTAEIEVLVNTSGAPTAVPLDINLPSGLVIDLDKLTSPRGEDTTSLGTGIVLDGGVAAFPARVGYSTTTSVRIGVTNASATYGTKASITNTIPFTFGSGDFVEARFIVPISGWSSNSVSSADTDTRVIATRVTGQPTGTIAATIAASGTTVFPTVSYDKTGSYSAGTYTVPVSGLYDIIGAIQINGTYALNQYINVGLYVNGSNVDYSVVYAGGANGVLVNSYSFQASLNAGDLVTIRSSSNATAPTFADAIQNKMTIKRLSGPAVVAATELVAAKYNTLSAVLTNANTPLNFSNRVQDTHGAVTTGAGVWKFTAPVSGTYAVSGCMLTASVAFGVGAVPCMLVRKGGVNNSFLGTHSVQTASAVPIAISGHTTVSMLAGEYLEFTFANVATLTPDAAATANAVSIHRIGN